jgi:hypothetical protein
MLRAQQQFITQDLAQKMVFLTGPRQVGKTYLAQEIAKGFQKSVYLNYDYFEDRDIIKNVGWLLDTELLILDELHKMRSWKNYLKGVYDTKPRNLKIIVTGSARLDMLRRSGDSMAGRFFTHRLNPLSLVEIPEDAEKNLERLLSRGGFPEPYLAETDEEANRWRMQYVDGLIRNDILDFEKVHDFKAFSLPSRCSASVSDRRYRSPLWQGIFIAHPIPLSVMLRFLRRFLSFSGSRLIIAILHGHFSKSQRYTFTIRV